MDLKNQFDLQCLKIDEEVENKRNELSNDAWIAFKAFGERKKSYLAVKCKKEILEQKEKILKEQIDSGINDKNISDQFTNVVMSLGAIPVQLNLAKRLMQSSECYYEYISGKSTMFDYYSMLYPLNISRTTDSEYADKIRTELENKNNEDKKRI